MQRNFKAVTGLDVGLDTDIVKSDSSFGMTADVFISSSRPVYANAYSSSVAAFFDLVKVLPYYL